MKQLESKKLTYIAAIAKNRQLTCQMAAAQRPSKYSVAQIAQMLTAEHFVPVPLNGDKPRTVWVALLQVHVPKLVGTRTVAIQRWRAYMGECYRSRLLSHQCQSSTCQCCLGSNNLSLAQLGGGILPRSQRVVGFERVSGTGCYQFAPSLDKGVHRLHLYPLASVNRRIP